MKKFGNKVFLRYIFFGGLTTSITFLLYWTLILFISYIKAYSISYFLGLFLSYLFNTRKVFNQKITFISAVKYFVIYIGNYFACTLLLRLLVEKFEINKFLGPLIIMPISVLISFILIKIILTEKNT